MFRNIQEENQKEFKWKYRGVYLGWLFFRKTEVVCKMVSWENGWSLYKEVLWGRRWDFLLDGVTIYLWYLWVLLLRQGSKDRISFYVFVGKVLYGVLYGLNKYICVFCIFLGLILFGEYIWDGIYVWFYEYDYICGCKCVCEYIFMLGYIDMI